MVNHDRVYRQRTFIAIQMHLDTNVRAQVDPNQAANVTMLTVLTQMCHFTYAFKFNILNECPPKANRNCYMLYIVMILESRMFRQYVFVKKMGDVYCTYTVLQVLSSNKKNDSIKIKKHNMNKKSSKKEKMRYHDISIRKSKTKQQVTGFLLLRSFIKYFTYMLL